jgi:hypothetical protein
MIQSEAESKIFNYSAPPKRFYLDTNPSSFGRRSEKIKRSKIKTK